MGRGGNPVDDPLPLRFTPATLRDRGRACGGGWEVSTIGIGHRRGASLRSPPCSVRGAFFRRGRAQVVRGEIMMIRSSLPQPSAPRPRVPDTGGLAAGAGGRS